MTGKAVLITGATGGLGRTVTQGFLEAGATVAGTARKWSPDEIPSGDFVAVEADLTGAKGVETAIAAILNRSGRLDVVVHLMGGFVGGRAVQDTSEETWDKMMAINLKSTFLLFQQALPIMVKQRSGRLIAIGSRPGLDPVAGLGAYAVSKAGVHALVRTVAAETKGTDVTANVVLPSTIDTEANRLAMPQADTSKWVTPASLAGLLLWLASEASRDVNGALIPIYGGA